MRKDYYSIRTGKNKNFHNFDLSVLKRLFKDLYSELDKEGYFQEYFGFECVDYGYKEGKLGNDKNIQAITYREIRKDLWPLIDPVTGFDHVLFFKEDDLFDLIEFLYEYVSKPINGHFHGFNNCGWHYESFNKIEGQHAYRQKMNEILLEYGEGFELNNFGQIIIKAEYGLKKIISSTVPKNTGINIESKIKFATEKYLNSRSNLQERKVAVRELADILELLRPQIKTNMLKKDENAIFQIANQFAIRHSNSEQIKDYDKNIWYSWMYYFYLSTIYALLKLLEKQRMTSK